MMEPATDIELLREYTEKGSEEAFATLVKRHVSLVYSAALRQVREADAAQEVTQATFIILTRKARQLDERTIVSAWLYRTARFAAADFLKMRARRIKHEQEAARMQSSILEPAWAEIEPLIDDAVNRLGEADRAAIVLRFFENKNFKEVGAALGLSEDTAQKRVTRAVDRLRKSFARDGVVSSATALAALLPAQAVPDALAISVTHAVTSQALISASTATLVKGTMKMIAWTKIKYAAGLIALLVVATGTATLVAQKHFAERTVPTARLPGDEDRATPLGALRFLARALDRFDGDKVSEAFFTQTPAQRRFITAMAAVTSNEGRLRQALETRFGTNGVASLSKRPMFAMSFGQEKLDAAEIQIDGTSAVAHIPGRNDGSDELRLVKAGQIWKVDGGKGDTPQAEDNVIRMEAVARATEALAEEVKNGAFDSTEAALRSMRSHIAAAMRPKP
jgi:RNA polymerase sigma factor (sigma-70 family)